MWYKPSVMSSAQLVDPYPGLVAPRVATPRDPGRRTMGGAVAKVADQLGRPLMPWQRLVADVGGEVDDAGLFVYPLVVVTVQRQAGKTALDLAQSVQRCLAGPRRKVWHTAQTGQEARKKWRELADELVATDLGRRVVAGKPKRGAGSEVLTFINGSSLRPHPPTRDGLHGEQSDTNNVDEAWAFDEAQGADLFQAIVPTQATRPGAQTWVWSTAGDRSSTWFRSLVNRGRAGEPGLAFFEWGIPDDADPTDLDVIARHHPAFGFTQTLDTFRRAQVSLADKPGEFARAYGNRWTGGGERVIPVEPWMAAQTEAPVPDGRRAFGVAVGVDGDTLWGSIVAVEEDAAGRRWWEVVEHRPGRSWLVDRVKALRDKGQGVAIMRSGPAAPVADQLDLDGVELLTPSMAEYTAACQDVFDRITTKATDPEDGREAWAPRIIHRRHDGLDTAADVAGTRGVGDGAWIWSRTKSTGDIGPLEAGTLGGFALSRSPAPVVLTADLMVFA
jgi:hypothetical protein